VIVDVMFVAWNRLEFTRAAFGCLLENTDWRLVRELVVYDDGSTDGTREHLDMAVKESPVPARVIHMGMGSPVAAMVNYLDRTDAEAFAKIDNDCCVPPGWITELVAVMERDPQLELLGMEAGFTEVPGRDDPGWDGTRHCRESSYIGGIGLMKVRAFEMRPVMNPNGRWGFSDWQHRHQPKRGWICPDLPVVLLDRLPFEPWQTLAERYVEEGWSRPWAPWDARWMGWAYDWFTEREGATGDAAVA
jgi:Glycosyl transferase family 2